MTTRRAYRLTSLYRLIIAVVCGLIVAYGPATGIITTIALLGCMAFGILAFWIFFASFSAKSKGDLAGFAIEILLNILLNR